MASTTALFTGLSGLSTNARRLDVIGNNIANVNTTGYKSSRLGFATAFAQTLGLGTAPSANTGGSNPTQVGLGVSIAGTQKNFNNGSVSATGISTDVAIEGDGFFIVDVAGEQTYSRDGSFQLNEAQTLVNIAGGKVLGYGVDAQFNVNSGSLQELNFQVGSMRVAEPTRNVQFRGNLNASGTVATTGSVHQSRAFYTDMGLTTALSDPNVDLLTTPLYISDGAGGAALAFDGAAANKILTFSGMQKGGTDLGSHSFAISATAVDGTDAFGTTLQDVMNFMDEILGLDNSDLAGEQLGGRVYLDTATGVVNVVSNEGTAQGLEIESADIVATGVGGGINQPFVMAQSGMADGDSVRTSFVVYDSLGTPLTVDLTMVLQSVTPGSGTTWSFVAESSQHAANDRIAGLGTMTFDGTGNFISSSNVAFSLTRDNGAVSPLTVNMDFTSTPNTVTSLTTASSELAATFQDGSAVGTLTAFSIAQDGKVSGSFTNGLTRTLGQVALARFSNPAGLVDIGGNNYRIGPNSGDALLTSPLQFGAGRLVGGSLELSNVDLSQEFISMILASTGYSASSRVIQTTDELIDQLLVLGR